MAIIVRAYHSHSPTSTIKRRKPVTITIPIPGIWLADLHHHYPTSPTSALTFAIRIPNTTFHRIINWPPALTPATFRALIYTTFSLAHSTPILLTRV